MHISRKLFPINSDEWNHFKPCQFGPIGKMHVYFLWCNEWRKGKKDRDRWKLMMVMNRLQELGEAKDQEAGLIWSLLMAQRMWRWYTAELAGHFPQWVICCCDYWAGTQASESWGVSAAAGWLAGWLARQTSLHLIKLAGSQLPEEQLKKWKGGSFCNYVNEKNKSKWLFFIVALSAAKHGENK